MGEKKKYKAHILKLVPCILKYLRPIFCPLKTRLKTGAKTQTNSDTRFRVRLGHIILEDMRPIYSFSEKEILLLH